MSLRPSGRADSAERWVSHLQLQERPLSCRHTGQAAASSLDPQEDGDLGAVQASVRKDTDLLWEVRQSAIQSLRGPQGAGFYQDKAQLGAAGSDPIWLISVWRLQGKWNSLGQGETAPTSSPYHWGNILMFLETSSKVRIKGLWQMDSGQVLEESSCPTPISPLPAVGSSPGLQLSESGSPTRSWPFRVYKVF